MGFINVALAEDHELMRQGLAAMIESEDGLEVAFEVSNGQELICKLSEQTPDVLLLDIEMPVLNGIEVLSMIYDQYPEVKTLMLSMHTDRDLVCDCIKRGAKGFLTKNCEFEKVLHAIKTVNRNGFYFDESLPISSLKNLIQSNEKVVIDHEVQLSTREIEIIRLVCQGYKNREIAEILFLSKRTIENHRRRIMAKTQSKSTVDLVVFALKRGLIELNKL